MNKISPHNAPPMFSRQWEAARDEARDLDKYAPNWDGADADPVPLELIQATLRFFRQLEEKSFPAPDLVYPAADGTVFAEWHHPGGFVQAANICPGRVRVVMMGPDGNIIPLPPDPPAGDTAGPRGGAACTDGDAFEFSLAA